MKTQQQNILKTFITFHAKNPLIWELLEEWALREIASGRSYGSVSEVFEYIRHHVRIKTQGQPVKLSNNHRAYYARLFHMVYPVHAGWFRTRNCPSAKRPAHSGGINEHTFDPPDPIDEQAVTLGLAGVAESILNRKKQSEQQDLL